MNPSPENPIADLLLLNVSRELMMSVEDALRVGAQRAYSTSEGMDSGHLPSALGQQRHFHMNEAFYRALAMADAQPTAIRGNRVITGRSGVVNLARFNSSMRYGNNGRRSLARRQMSLVNQAIEPLVLGDLFGEYRSPTDVTAFFVATFSGSLLVQPELPLSIHIVVPDRMMQGWLFKEPVQAFVQRYDQVPDQVDQAMPRLKVQKKTQDFDGSAS